MARPTRPRLPIRTASAASPASATTARCASCRASTPRAMRSATTCWCIRPAGWSAATRWTSACAPPPAATGSSPRPVPRASTARDGELALQRTELASRAGARLEWLPLEAICFSGCRAENRLSLRVARRRRADRLGRHRARPAQRRQAFRARHAAAAHRGAGRLAGARAHRRRRPAAAAEPARPRRPALPGIDLLRCRLAHRARPARCGTRRRPRPDRGARTGRQRRRHQPACGDHRAARAGAGGRAGDAAAAPGLAGLARGALADDAAQPPRIWSM